MFNKMQKANKKKRIVWIFHHTQELSHQCHSLPTGWPCCVAQPDSFRTYMNEVWCLTTEGT